jgi:hypothetical protein
MSLALREAGKAAARCVGLPRRSFSEGGLFEN